SPGEIAKRTITLNVRRPGSIRLKPREHDYPNWDEKLSLDFTGNTAAVRDVQVKRNDDAITVYLAGDSTVTDQQKEPYASWGQMLPRFFKPGVAVANYAESGESIRSSLAAKRFEKIFSLLRPGDWLFIQFGHNDMKEKGPGVGAFT